MRISSNAVNESRHVLEMKTAVVPSSLVVGLGLPNGLRLSKISKSSNVSPGGTLIVLSGEPFSSKMMNSSSLICSIA